MDNLTATAMLLKERSGNSQSFAGFFVAPEEIENSSLNYLPEKPKEKSKRILVTGGAGYVGSVLVPELLNRGYSVRVVDSLMYNHHPSLLTCFLDSRFEFRKGDIRDAAFLREALNDVDAIIHLAAIVGEPACRKNPELCYAVNQQGTALLNSLKSPDQKLIFASTGSVYGKVEGICTEEVALNPVSDYGISKLAAERIITTRGNYIIYRFATAFGLAHSLRLDLLVNDFVWRALKEKTIIVYEANFRRTFIHVRDMAESLIFAFENFDRMKNNIYNVGHESMNFTKADIAKKIQSKVNFHLHFADFGADPDQRNYEVSYAKIRAAGFETKISLEQGIDEMVNGLQMVNIQNPYTVA
jgi:nucleoside-diphosphate-sugar epimerase